MSTDTRDEALAALKDMRDRAWKQAEFHARANQDSAAERCRDQFNALGLAIAALAAPVAPASAPVERNLPTERRVAAVELLLAQGYRWDNGKWVAPPAGAVEDALWKDPRDFANDANPTRCAQVWNDAVKATLAALSRPEPAGRVEAVAWQYRWKCDPTGFVYNTFVHPIEGNGRTEDEIEWWVYGVKPAAHAPQEGAE